MYSPYFVNAISIQKNTLLFKTVDVHRSPPPIHRQMDKSAQGKDSFSFGSGHLLYI